MDRDNRQVESAADGDDWQPVHIASMAARGRSRGFPDSEADHAEVEKWCRDRCTAGWRAEAAAGRGRTYWFEDADDAMAFAMTWFPFKCT